MGAISKYRSTIIFLTLFALGAVLIGVSNTFQREWMKVQLDRLLAEVGALILVIGTLHWFFEFGLREQMLRDVASTAVGSAHMYHCGLETCKLNARDVDERAHWSQSASLTVGYQYSPSFFKNFHDVFSERCRRRLPTRVAILRHDGAAARYLHDATSGNPNIRQSISDITDVFREIDPAGEHCSILLHDRVLRYSFIHTDEHIWVKFYANGSGRTTVPALKIRAGSPLFQFFEDDIKRVLENSREH